MLTSVPTSNPQRDMRIAKRKAPKRGLIARVVSRIKSYTPRTVQVSSWFLGLTTTWANISYAKITQAALANPVSYRAIQIIADAVGDIRIHLHERNGDELEEKGDHPFMLWFRKPDGVSSTRQFMRKLTIYGILAGNNYLWLRGSGPFFNAETGLPTGRKPKTVHLLQPDHILEVKRDEVTDDITGYRWVNRRGRHIIIPADEIIHIKDFNPLDTEYGYAAINAAWNALQLMDAANDWNKSVYDAKGRLPGIVAYDGAAPMDTETLERTQDIIWDKWGMSSRRSAPWLLNKFMKFVPSGSTQRDADWNAAMLQYMRMIAIALGIDPALLGDAANKTYSNLETALRSAYILTAIPRLSGFLDELTCRLLPLWDTNPKLELGFERNQIEALQEDQTALYTRLTAAAGRPWLHVDDARTAAGVPTVGDERIPMPMNLVEPLPDLDEPQTEEQQLQHDFVRFTREVAQLAANGAK